jgi:hypothetical protein
VEFELGCLTEPAVLSLLLSLLALASRVRKQLIFADQFLIADDVIC